MSGHAGTPAASPSAPPAGPVRAALEAFLQGVLDHPANARRWRRLAPARRRALAADLWRDGLLLVFRLLFALRGGAGAAVDPLPLLDTCAWDGDGHARLLESLLPLAPGDLPPEDLGRVYEALLDLEPGLATEPMARLRRGNRELVVPAAQAHAYRAPGPAQPGRRTRVRWVDDILPRPGSPGTLYLCAGLGRKTSGSYYSPPDLVRFLVRETLGPLVEPLSPPEDPRPQELLRLTVLDPAMGGGGFLLEACRFLGERLERACRDAAARGLRDRLPPGVVAYLSDGSAAGRERLVDLCKGLVASRCLYGVDRDPLAVELARAALSLEAGPGAPAWTVLERHLVHGDSLTGPAAADLPHLRPPAGARDGPLPPRFRRHLEAALTRARDGAVEDPLAAFRALALAWTGAVMLRGDREARAAYAGLFAHVAQHGALPARLSPGVLRLVRRGSDDPAVAFDLAFPEVFYPDGPGGGRHGFHAVLCNPPWEALRPAQREFFAAYDLTVLDAPTARERGARVAELLRRPDVAAAWSAYRDRIEGRKACHDRLYRWQKVRVGGGLAGRYSDHYRVFAERAAGLVRPDGRVGLVLPAAFHANEGATGIRRLYLEEMALQCCYSFENRRRLFPIDPRCKFALVVAARRGPTTTFPCAFYLHDPAWLFQGRRPLHYSLEFLRRTGGDCLTFVEGRRPEDVELLEALLPAGRPLQSLERTHGLVFRTEPYAFNVTTHGHWFTPAEAAAPAGHLVLEEGKSFHQFTDRWGTPRYAVPVEAAARRPAALANARSFRLAFRTIAHATNERTALFTVLPPGVLVSNSVAVEAAPERRPNGVALWACAALNAFAFDLTVRLKGGANMNLFLMRTGLLPAALPEAFLAHAALRLVCNHDGFAPLWREQLGEAWREPGKPVGRWPVLGGEEERWQLRAAIDAAVAAAFGLSRAQYANLLGTFRHRSQPAAPAWCLERFDEHTATGPEAFSRRHDPYWDVPLPVATSGPLVGPASGPQAGRLWPRAAALTPRPSRPTPAPRRRRSSARSGTG